MTLQIWKMMPPTSEKIPSQKIATPDFPKPTPFIFHVVTERQERVFVGDAISFTENLKYTSTKFLPLKSTVRVFIHFV